MSHVTLLKWGNSMGIRIPMSIIKDAHLTPGEELQITINNKGGLTLTPIKQSQAGWLEAFNAVADADKDKPLIDVSNKFDEDEWTW